MTVVRLFLLTLLAIPLLAHASLSTVFFNAFPYEQAVLTIPARGAFLSAPAYQSTFLLLCNLATSECGIATAAALTAGISSLNIL